MSAKSDYLENKVLQDNVVTPNVYVGLFSTDPGEDASGTELSNLGYSRQLVAFGTPSGGSTSNTAAVTFGPAQENWSTASYMAVFDAASGGNMLYYGALGTARTALQYDSLEFAIGALVVGET